MRRLIFILLSIGVFLTVYTISTYAIDKHIKLPKEEYRLIDSLNNLSYQNRRHNPRLSLEYALEAYKLATAQGNEKGLGFAIHNMGTAKSLLGNYDKGLEDLIAASIIREGIDDFDGLVSTYNNIGYVFFEMGNNEKALDFYEKALDIQKEIGKTKDVGIILNNIGYLHYHKQNFEQALSFFHQALEVNIIDKDERGIAASKSNIGNIYRNIGEFRKGLNNHLEALELAQKHNDKLGIIGIFKQISEDYIRLNKLDSALIYAQKSFDLARDTELKVEEKNAIEVITKIYEQTGNYVQLVKYYKLLNTLKDSIYKTKKADVLSRAQVLHELEQQTKENEFLVKEQQINSQRIRMHYYLLVLAGVLIAITIGFAVFIVFATTKVKHANKTLIQKNQEIYSQNETIQSKAKTLDEKNNELKSINQIKDKLISVIAHDLKNPFNSISGYSEVIISEFNSYSESEHLTFLRIIHDSATKGNMLLDNLLQWSRLQTKTLQFAPEEQSLYKLVVDELFFVQHIANEKDITISTNIDENLSVFADANMLKTVIRNLVSNSIKFTHSKGSVNISGQANRNTAIIEVCDSGVGIEQKVMDKLFSGQSGVTTPGVRGEEGTGLGLMICKDFIDMHKGRIWAESQLGKGTSIFVELPNKTEYPHS